VSIACYAFRAEDVEFETYLDDGNNPDEPGWFIEWLQERKRVDAFTFDGAWFDIGTPESYLDAVSWALDGKSIIAESATVTDSSVGENVHVMDNATVKDSTLERTLVFPGATVENSELRQTIVDEKASVSDIDLSGALVGAHSQIP